MAELIAQGPRARDRRRWPLPDDEPFVLGREAPPWSVAWEPLLSRRHLSLVWRDGALEGQKLPEGRNPVFVNGDAADTFRLKPGERFVVGRTTFTLAESPTAASGSVANLIQKRTFTAAELKQARVQDAAHQIDVLGRLPEVIANAADERELYVGLVNLLLAGVARAEAVVLVSLEEPGEQARPRVLAWERRQVTGEPFRPSSRLIAEAVRQQETVLHVWSAAPDGAYTQYAGSDWAFCTPVRGDVPRGWAIYVAGRFGGDAATAVMQEAGTSELVDDLKFTELVAALWGSLHQVNVLKHRQASLSQFFSPAVLAALAGADPDKALRPRKAYVTVLFCDLRGFAREAEKHELLALLEGVSKALGHMTQSILDEGGVIGDFHGDAAMGFWGWPLEQPDRVRRACLAALGIDTLFQAVARQPNHPLANFRVGIGLAGGPAVAGKIGTVNQVKVTVFGPVVNLASRLEAMTKRLRVSILLDEATARAVRAQVPPAVARVRRLAVVRPYGLETPLTVSQLLPPAGEDALLSDAHLVAYEAALDAFVAGQWPRAYELPPQDRGKDFLIAFILQNNHTPPPGWDGVIPLASKE